MGRTYSLAPRARYLRAKTKLLNGDILGTSLPLVIYAAPLCRRLAGKLVLKLSSIKRIFLPAHSTNRHNALECLVSMAVTGALIASNTHITNAFENSRGHWGRRISNIAHRTH